MIQHRPSRRSHHRPVTVKPRRSNGKCPIVVVADECRVGAHRACRRAPTKAAGGQALCANSRRRAAPMVPVPSSVRGVSRKPAILKAQVNVRSKSCCQNSDRSLGAAAKTPSPRNGVPLSSLLVVPAYRRRKRGAPAVSWSVAPTCWFQKCKSPQQGRAVVGIEEKAQHATASSSFCRQQTARLLAHQSEAPEKVNVACFRQQAPRRRQYER